MSISGSALELVYDVMPHRYRSSRRLLARGLFWSTRAMFPPCSPTWSHLHRCFAAAQRRVWLGTAITESRDHVVLWTEHYSDAPRDLGWRTGQDQAMPASAGPRRRIDAPRPKRARAHPVFAVGDIANIPTGEAAALPAASPSSPVLGRPRCPRRHDGTGREPFHYRDMGIMAGDRPEAVGG